MTLIHSFLDVINCLYNLKNKNPLVVYESSNFSKSLPSYYYLSFKNYYYLNGL
jgi:hypothetical protein